MNGVLKLPFYYLLLFLAVFVALAVFSLLHTWGTVYNPTAPYPEYLFAATFIVASTAVLSPAVLLSIVMLLFRLVVLGGNRVLSLAILGISALLVYLGSLAVVDGLNDALRSEILDLSYAVPEEQFLSFPEADLFVGEADFLRLSPVVVHRPDASPGFSRYEAAVRDPESNDLIIPEGGLSFPIPSAEQAYVSLFDAPPFLGALFADIGVLTERLTTTYGPGSPLFYVTPLSLVMAAVGAWCFVRLTRWPLFNGLLVLVFIRGVVFIYALFEGEFFRELAGSALDESVLAYVAPGFLVLIALVLYAIALLMPPFEEWRREIGDE